MTDTKTKSEQPLFDPADPQAIFDEGYGISPNKVLFTDQISDAAKLLYFYIASLTARDGWCTAKNRHLAEKFNKSTRQITRLVAELVQVGLVFERTNDNGTRTGMTVFWDSRKGVTKMSRGVDKNVVGGVTKMSDLTGANNISDKHKVISKEKSDQINKLYTGYLLHFKLPVDHPALSDPDYKTKMLDDAKKQYRLTDLRKRKLATRLDDCGYDMIKMAIINCSKSDWHRGDDPKSGGWYAKLEWLCSSYEKIEDWSSRDA